MNHRERAAAIATQFQGRCTCAAMDGGVDCPWCQVFHDVPGAPGDSAPAGAKTDADPVPRLISWTVGAG